MAQFKVAKGRSILMPAQKESRSHADVDIATDLLKEGAIIDSSQMSPKEIENKLKNGVIVAVGTDEGTEPPKDNVPTVPHTQDDQNHLTVGTGTKVSSGAASETRSPAPQGQQTVPPPAPEQVRQEVTQKEPQPEVQTVDSPWKFSPAELEGKELDELRIMALERHPEPENFDPEEELPNIEAAVQFLSQDFEE